MKNKKILICDECSFTRVCSALLENSGYETETVTLVDDRSSVPDVPGFGLVVTSYPLGARLLRNIRRYSIPAIILSDDIDEDLFAMLKDLSNCYCMMKPVDYGKFRSLVKEVLSGEKSVAGGPRFLV